MRGGIAQFYRVGWWPHKRPVFHSAAASTYVRAMKTPISLILSALATLALALALAGPASAAKKVKYAGKTSSGHPITFTVRGNKIYDPKAGLRISCLPIQGSGAPLSGADYIDPLGWLQIGKTVKYHTLEQASLGWDKVTKQQRFTSRRRRHGIITGTIRMQYEFLVPSYTPGTFTIYSCLGKVTYKAKPKKADKR
jgi:hypothetical protein